MLEQKRELDEARDKLGGETKARLEVEGLVDGLGDELERARGRIDEMMANQGRM